MSATPRPSPCTTWKLRLLRLLRLSPLTGRRPPCLRFRVFAVWAPVGNEIPPTPLSGRGRDFVHRILESSEPCQALHASSRPSARRLVLSRILAKVKEKKETARLHGRLLWSRLRDAISSHRSRSICSRHMSGSRSGRRRGFPLGPSWFRRRVLRGSAPFRNRCRVHHWRCG